jgi:hypothetical protein
MGPLLDGVPRFGGALLSPWRPPWIKTQNAVCPVATVMLYFDASQCLLPPFRDFRDQRIPSNPLAIRPPYAATVFLLSPTF